MGQKVSSSHSSSEISLSKKDSSNVKLKTKKKLASWSREKVNADVLQTAKNPIAEYTEKLDDDDGTQRSKTDVDDDDYATFDGDSLAYPSIAELSNFTALSMMRNLEDVSLAHSEANDKSMDEEMCFNTINYEDMAVLQLVEDAMNLRRDSSTCTSEIKEASSTPDEEKLSCKDPPMEKSTDDGDEEETLAAKLQRAELERDAARSKLRLAEVRCEAYEEESKCLEASMESMEEKLRTIVCELRHEVAKSKDLERQLSSSFQSSADDGLGCCEKLVSQAAAATAALHS